MERDKYLLRVEKSMTSIGKVIYEDKLATSGYSPAQNHVLVVIGRDGSISVKELAKELSVTSGAATQHIDALEKAGLLIRKMNPDDRRGVVVETTNLGNEVCHKIILGKKRMLKKLFISLSDDELSTLVILFEKISHTYNVNEGETNEKI